MSFAPYFYEDLVFVADIARGVDIIRLDDGAADAKRRRTPVQAPPMSPAGRAAAERMAARFEADPASGYLCLLPRT